jgi:hypothetical protein
VRQKFRILSSSANFLWNFASTEKVAESYLELSQGETAAGTDTAVVLDGRASHNGSELVDGSGSKGSGLGLAGSASPRLLAGLYHTSQYFKLMMEFFRDSIVFSRRGIAIPGRSGFEPGAANPCGSLYEGSVAGVLDLVGFHRWWCSRLLTSFWLCLIACGKSSQRMSLTAMMSIALGAPVHTIVSACDQTCSDCRWSVGS